MKNEKAIVLKKKEDRRIRAGHLWVFSNEIERTIGEPGNGDCVRVFAANGDLLGVGFHNRNSLIAVRMLDRIAEHSPIDIVEQRIRNAEARRRKLGYHDSYRLIHGEADFIPGLVVDRYEDNLVIESFSAGIDGIIGEIAAVLDKIFLPTRIVEKSTSVWRSYESLEQRVKIWKGDDEAFIANIGGLRYLVDPLRDQKTGLFLDQAANRLLVEPLAKGLHVLDCFCNVGGFSLHAVRGGAENVVAVDASSQSILRGSENAALNGIQGIQFIEQDVFQFFKENKQRFDLIVLDPPAFVKNKKSLAVGLKAYRKINEAAMACLNEGGILVSCSCSHHVTMPLFMDMIADAAARQEKQISIFRTAGAAADHPVLLSMQETQYLTCVFAQVI
jgi:23S rRNA (cytosine1962-C5)-methyltransferase